jgi:glycosyltransferase involved in cell wall biosynthesis
MRIVIFSSGFNLHEMKLQPWLTLSEIGVRLQSAGHEVWLATDGESNEVLPLPTRRFRSLRGTDSAAITAWLKDLAPHRSVVSVSPFSLATANWHAAFDPQSTWAFFPYALYNVREMASAWRHLRNSERWGYGRNLLIPQELWRQRLAQRFRSVICQSRRTADRLGADISFEVIQPGLDLMQWQPVVAPTLMADKKRTFLYVGSPKAIRGFEFLLKAMLRLPPEICLRVLARGLDAYAEAQLKAHMKKIGLCSRVSIRGGWLPPEDLRAEIQNASAVVLPFILVPSELPVSVMEVVACGTPVIVSDIDGLPEAAGSAGITVPAGDPIALAEAMKSFAADGRRQQILREACRVRRQQYLGWPEVSSRWAAVLEASV